MSDASQDWAIRIYSFPPRSRCGASSRTRPPAASRPPAGPSRFEFCASSGFCTRLLEKAVQDSPVFTPAGAKTLFTDSGERAIRDLLICMFTCSLICVCPFIDFAGITCDRVGTELPSGTRGRQQLDNAARAPKCYVGTSFRLTALCFFCLLLPLYPCVSNPPCKYLSNISNASRSYLHLADTCNAGRHLVRFEGLRSFFPPPNGFMLYMISLFHNKINIKYITLLVGVSVTVKYLTILTHNTILICISSNIW